MCAASSSWIPSGTKEQKPAVGFVFSTGEASQIPVGNGKFVLLGRKNKASTCLVGDLHHRRSPFVKLVCPIRQGSGKKKGKRKGKTCPHVRGNHRAGLGGEGALTREVL